MARRTLTIIITLFTILAASVFSASAGAACTIGINSASASTSNIAVSFNASAECDGTVYVYVVDYSTDTDLVFASVTGVAGTGHAATYNFSMVVNDGANISMNVYHMGGTGGHGNATWAGAASGVTLAAGGGTSGATGCAADGRLNASTCGGDNFAAYVSSGDNGSTVQVWDADSNSLAFFVDAATINNVPETVSSNTLVASNGNYRLYKLTSGEFQLMVPKPDGKTAVMIFNLPFDGSVVTREE